MARETEETEVDHLLKVEYAVRRFHDLYFGRISEQSEFFGSYEWENFNGKHRNALFYAIEMLIQEGTIEIKKKTA